MRRLLRVVSLLPLLALAVALALVCYSPTSTRPVYWPLRYWSRWLARLLGLRVRVYGQAHHLGTLYVANHISWLDIFCLASAYPSHFVAKQEVAQWPLFGWLCRRVGTLFVQRGAAASASEQLLWRLRQGQNVTLFPEGTTTDGASVRRFQPRLLQAAIHAGVPIQAVALRYPHSNGVHPRVPFIGEDELLSHLWALLAEPGLEVELHFCAPLSTVGASRDQLARQAQMQVEQALQLTPIIQPQRA